MTVGIEGEQQKHSWSTPSNYGAQMKRVKAPTMGHPLCRNANPTLGSATNGLSGTFPSHTIFQQIAQFLYTKIYLN